MHPKETKGRSEFFLLIFSFFNNIDAGLRVLFSNKASFTSIRDSFFKSPSIKPICVLVAFLVSDETNSNTKKFRTGYQTSQCLDVIFHGIKKTIRGLEMS